MAQRIEAVNRSDFILIQVLCSSSCNGYRQFKYVIYKRVAQVLEEIARAKSHAVLGAVDLQFAGSGNHVIGSVHLGVEGDRASDPFNGQVALYPVGIGRASFD